MNHLRTLFVCLVLFTAVSANAQKSTSAGDRLSLLPYPKEVTRTNLEFAIDSTTNIVVDKNASAEDRFAAADLASFLSEKFQLRLPVTANGAKGILLTRRGGAKKLGDEGYNLQVGRDAIVIHAPGSAGIFYGVQTLKQLISQKDSRPVAQGVNISDWPDTRNRAAHYDTKHHQDKREYVEKFIRDLAKYKMNMLVWEWEDKFEYPSHPEIGAPGAFTMSEMQSLTRYAKQYHIQIVPLVQGLGHVSFILKWPQFASLREVPSSNFEFCPLKDSSYALLFDLWKDAMAATPGSAYIHIGSDETYELGACPLCQKKQQEIGKSGLYHLFLSKCSEFIRRSGRKVMAWEAPMGWEKARLQVYHPDSSGEKPVVPVKGLVLTESYDYETPGLDYAKQAKALGHPVFAYDPNPGIEQLFLPYFFRKGDHDEILSGALENSYHFLQTNLGKGVFDGVTKTSWDDSGLPLSAWMLGFAVTAAYSWNATGDSLSDFTASFFNDRYGPQAASMETLYRMLNEGSYFYMESFERRVWAWGEIGKTHIPDLPRGDAIEYDPYWNTQYADRVRIARTMIPKMDSALAICQRNVTSGADNAYDIKTFETIAALMKHTAQTYLDLSALEDAVKLAHQQRFVDLSVSIKSLQHAREIVQAQLDRRKKVYDDVVAVWDESRLPKGMSTANKKYFFEQDRTRHFANRVPDMSYLIVDEQHLGLEDYLGKLDDYISFLTTRFNLQ